MLIGVSRIKVQYTAYGVGLSMVLEYANVLRKKWPNAKMHIFFNNFVSTLQLLELLSNKNFQATGTIRENRTPNSPLMDSKEMKKATKRHFDCKKTYGKNICIVKWHDISIVTLCSNSAGVNPVHSVKRFSRKEKKLIQVNFGYYSVFIILKFTMIYFRRPSRT